MTDYANEYDSLVIKLAKEHAHEDSKSDHFEIQKDLTNGLDYDEVGELIEDGADNLSFVNSLASKVWLDQNEELLVFIREETPEDLEFISVHFDHLEPPTLRDKYDLPPPL